MKIDKKTLDMLSSLPDDKLWQVLNVIASSSGISLGAPPNDKEQIARLREAMGSVTENDLDRAAQIVDIYRVKTENGINSEKLTEMLGKLSESGALSDIMAALSSSAKPEKEASGESIEASAKVIDEHVETGGGEEHNDAASSSPDIMSFLSPEMLGMIPKLAALMGDKGGGEKSDGEEKKRRALLSALRPYLNDKRRHALDLMIGMESIGLFGEHGEARR